MGVRPRNKEQASRSTSCSTTRSAWSRSSARPAPARRCSRSPRASKRTIEDGVHAPARRRVRSCRSAATSASCPATSTRSSTRGCSRSSTTSSSSSRPARQAATSRRGLRRAARERADPGRAAHVHPRSHRCRSSIMIVDEAQNLTPARGEDDHHPLRGRHEDRAHRRPGPDRQPVRRCGQQRLDHGRRAVQDRSIAGHIVLSKGERSELAERATELL